MAKLLLFLFLIPFTGTSQMASIELESKPVPVPSTRESSVVKWNAEQPGYAGLSQESKDFFYWVNYCRSSPEKFWDSVVQPVLKAFPALKGPDSESLYKDLLKAGPLSMFKLNSSLVNTAQAHALDQARKSRQLGHNSSDGTSFGIRMKNAGIKRCANENIALASQGTILAVLLLYLDIGVQDKGHRKSLLDPNLKENGIGSAPYGKDQVFFVQDLSCAQ